jgi:hypothetical protein
VVYAQPVAVKFHEPKTDLVEAVAPLDSTQRVNIQIGGGMMWGLNADGIRLTFSTSVRPMFKIDNQQIFPTAGMYSPLAKTPQGKARYGFSTAFTQGKVAITNEVEATPTKPAKAGEQRRLDAVMSRYIVKNNDNVAHTVAMRIRIDTYCNNDGALFAAPTFPGKILDGMEMKGKTLPPYVQILQVPNLANPVNTGHFALKLGSKIIGPDRFVCTYHGAGENGWEVQVQQAMGDSDCVMYWNDYSVPPGGTVAFGFAYGKGLAVTPESEGRYNITFGGSFEPGKLVTITANVDDPLSNQTIELELPTGMELVEGKRVQPVPTPPLDLATSVVLWKCRVKELGEHTLRFRSSNGMSQTRTVTVTRP